MMNREYTRAVRRAIAVLFVSQELAGLPGTVMHEVRVDLKRISGTFIAALVGLHSLYC